ncbi:hypothetical protein [Sphingomonas sp. UV9]|uniref:hypothetical protein n=1 Tax=Sphingomonas sp. UV9 TaxID=1851410 RepID=UPI0026948339
MGNFQYLSIGNLSASDKACLFIMDYPRRTRLKLYVHAETMSLDADPDLTATVIRGATGRVERIIRMTLQTFDWNCPQHIVPRYTEDELADTLQPVRERLARLEAENAALRARIEASQPKRRPSPRLPFILLEITR